MGRIVSILLQFWVRFVDTKGLTVWTDTCYRFGRTINGSIDNGKPQSFYFRGFGYSRGFNA